MYLAEITGQGATALKIMGDDPVVGKGRGLQRVPRSWFFVTEANISCTFRLKIFTKFGHNDT